MARHHVVDQDEIEQLLRRGAYGTLRDDDEATEAARCVVASSGRSF
jgi:hypothetical protein